MAERTRTAGWLPRQHGAWAMLVVPFATGAMLVWRDDRLPAYVATMFATWVLGYFAFHAASGLLKSASGRRGRWLPALACYGGATAAAGVLTALEAGPAVLWWPVIFGLPLAVALWLASRRRERDLAGGLMTVAIASAMVLVVAYPDLSTMPGDPDLAEAVELAAVMFGYFGGTVFHIKAMIRRRGQLAWRNLSIGWHAGWTMSAAAAVVAAGLSRVWAVFFLIATIRAWLLPVVGERRIVRPWLMGTVEVLLSAVALGIALVTILPDGG